MRCYRAGVGWRPVASATLLALVALWACVLPETARASQTGGSQASVPALSQLPSQFRDLFDQISSDVDKQIQAKGGPPPAGSMPLSAAPAPASAASARPSVRAAPSHPAVSQLMETSVTSQSASQARQIPTTGSSLSNSVTYQPTGSNPLSAFMPSPLPSLSDDLTATANNDVMQPDMRLPTDTPNDLGGGDLASLASTLNNDIMPAHPAKNPALDSAFEAQVSTLKQYQQTTAEMLHQVYSEYNARNSLLPEMNANLARTHRDAKNWVRDEEKKARKQIEMQKVHLAKHISQLSTLEALVKDSEAKQRYYQDELQRMESERALQTQQPISPAVAASTLSDAEYMQRKSEITGYIHTTGDVVRRGYMQIHSRRQYVDAGNRWLLQASHQLQQCLTQAAAKVAKYIQSEKAKIAKLRAELMQLRKMWIDGLHRKKLLQIELNKVILAHQIAGLKERLVFYEGRGRHAADEYRQAVADQLLLRRQISSLNERVKKNSEVAAKIPQVALQPPTTSAMPPPITQTQGSYLTPGAPIPSSEIMVRSGNMMYHASSQPPVYEHPVPDLPANHIEMTAGLPNPPILPSVPPPPPAI